MKRSYLLRGESKPTAVRVFLISLIGLMAWISLALDIIREKTAKEISFYICIYGIIEAIALCYRLIRQNNSLKSIIMACLKAIIIGAIPLFVIGGFLFIMLGIAACNGWHG
ncbi:MAG: hypothetical protein J6Y82_12235 [Bacteroidales bacterium]|nr:hypothetical protein [Bacteroidales bacterium]